MLGTLIDPPHALRLGEAAHQASVGWLGLDCDDFLRCYNRSPFLVRHRLHDGANQVKLWDREDNDVMPDVEKDRYLAYDADFRPPYKPSIETKARLFELRPGVGVHHPFIAPHVVSTASTFSISLAITYRTRRTDMWTQAHRLNHALRQYGWQPHPVGTNPALDRTKASLTRLVRHGRVAARTVRQLLDR